MNFSIAISRKIALAYSAVCKPLCRQLELPQTAFDILMFLGNNPDYKTASEIVEIRHIKANLVSVNVDRLVREGYLTRRGVEGDRRKTELLCTEKAQPIIARGRQLQNAFSERLFAGMDEEARRAFSEAMHLIEHNLNELLEADEA
ncbi:MAG: MarR family transcriptional regulator [Oscillibacter sp.]|jgi:DNA-binding MarR family transcriptional regulator|nr:MarR family transcriptional regulator [Oscillibacter sp.]MDD7000139.1 MarR family winged helix-turn-helix transcriptional regulator [Oscillibacter sp.]MDY4396732.1 MarR family winged helix-turn-helix transcriptional regulator [Oscillospiraceae bacterium]MDY5018095.1 MarR family winged helix-turn-helix transcriptional regulator [Oscillospiraceae bacterium]